MRFFEEEPHEYLKMLKLPSILSPQSQIIAFIEGLPEPKKSEMMAIHQLIQTVNPDGKLWFDTGVNEDGKVVANPTAGYGLQTLQYANGKTRDYFQIGLSANTTGISIYLLGIKDKKYLVNAYGNHIGKASVTGYCIKFKSINDIHLDVLKDAIRFGFEATAR